VGYDEEAREYLVMDPAASYASIRVSEGQMEQARRAFGTDEDLIVVPLRQEAFERALGLQLLQGQGQGQRQVVEEAVAAPGTPSRPGT
jgi:hypothetical protein